MYYLQNIGLGKAHPQYSQEDERVIAAIQSTPVIDRELPYKLTIAYRQFDQAIKVEVRCLLPEKRPSLDVEAQ